MTVKEYNRAVDAYADSLYRFVLKNLKDKHMSSDIVQETFEKLWVKLEDVTALKVKTYLFTTAYHTMIDHIRKFKSVGSIEDIPETGSKTFRDYSDLKEVLDGYCTG